MTAREREEKRARDRVYRARKQGADIPKINYKELSTKELQQIGRRVNGEFAISINPNTGKLEAASILVKGEAITLPELKKYTKQLKKTKELEKKYKTKELGEPAYTTQSGLKARIKYVSKHSTKGYYEKKAKIWKNNYLKPWEEYIRRNPGDELAKDIYKKIKGMNAQELARTVKRMVDDKVDKTAPDNMYYLSAGAIGGTNVGSYTDSVAVYFGIDPKSAKYATNTP